MSRKNKRESNTSGTKNAPPLNITMSDGMSASEMQSLIVSALLEYDQKKQERDKQIEANALNEWRQRIGYKDFSDRKFLSRIVLTIANSLMTLLKVLFMRKKQITGDFATISLMRIAVSLVFSIAKWVLWGISTFLFLAYPCSLIVPGIPEIRFSEAVLHIEIGLITLLFAQLFRIASIEIEKMKDRNYIVDIFAAVAAVAAIIISLVIR